MNLAIVLSRKTFSQTPIPASHSAETEEDHSSRPDPFSLSAILFQSIRVSRDMFFRTARLALCGNDVSPDGGRYGEIVTIYPVRGSQHFIERIILE